MASKFICPLTLERTLQPVLTPCGHIFDRASLELRRQLGGEHASSCAVCHAPLADAASECYGLAVDASLRAQAEAWHVEQSALEAALRDGSWVDPTSVAVDQSSELGKGTYGIVRRGSWDGNPVAVKQVPLAEEGAAQGLHAELGALRSLRHPHIVELLGVCKTTEQIWLLLELAPHGSLDALLRGTPAQLAAALGSATALPGATPAFFRIGAEVACALSCLHRRHLVHGNVKPTNVLICEGGIAKLADFGLSALAHTQRVSGRLAASFAAPEASAPGGRLSAPSDVFALAILLAQCLSGEPPFAHLPDDAAVSAAIHAGERPTVPPGTPGALRHLISRAWTPRAAERPTADSVHLELVGLSGAPRLGRMRAPSVSTLPFVAEAGGGA
ncbi:hypothetical protein KFE25_013931 [Diacronema lutheri]|uniref:Protein kinase domain-containing protein n=2 Tax=Diacronema lutheri TaxID=2081491 RepID=A0A8J5XIP5_DIALT|nr:hypothetical protein KFE25_013931 [Diacronema lutheri]